MEEPLSIPTSAVSASNEIASLLAQAIIRRQNRPLKKASTHSDKEPDLLDNSATLCLYDNTPEKTTEADHD